MYLLHNSQTNPDEFFPPEDLQRLQVEERDKTIEKVDASIADKVDTVLWKDDVLRKTDYLEIDVHVKDRVVYLNGYVNGAMNLQLVEDAVGTVQGILDVKNRLYQDDKLLSEVSAALGRIEGVYGNKFSTGVRHGVVVLNGEVSGPTERFLAENCAAGIPGVRGVINYLRIRGKVLDAEDQRFLQPSIGEEIIFLDGLSGRVKQVIINPVNRRVIAIIIQRHLPSLQQEARSLEKGKASPPEQLIVIPVRVVRYITRESGFLSIQSTDTAQYEFFNPSRFNVPHKDWVPPYPYRTNDVLF
jgi:osmotically-inducible protein OsmY